MGISSIVSICGRTLVGLPPDSIVVWGCRPPLPQWVWSQSVWTTAATHADAVTSVKTGVMWKGKDLVRVKRKPKFSVSLLLLLAAVRCYRKLAAAANAVCHGRSLPPANHPCRGRRCCRCSDQRQASSRRATWYRTMEHSRLACPGPGWPGKGE